MTLFRPLVTFILALLLSGCALFSGEERVLPEAELWKGAMAAMAEDNYEIAIKKLEDLEARYPFGRYSAQAQLEMIYAYYRTSRQEQARAAADRFTRLHPQHENIDYAYYLKGLTNFDADLDVITRYTPTDKSMRDPGAARDSFNDFAILLNRHPNSQYAPDARLRMIYLRNQLAAYEIHVARYYQIRGAHLAAANRGRYVVENYQQTPAVPEALWLMAQSYHALELNDLAEDAERVLRSNFPDFQKDAETPPTQLTNSPKLNSDIPAPPKQGE